VTNLPTLLRPHRMFYNCLSILGPVGPVRPTEGSGTTELNPL